MENEVRVRYAPSPTGFLHIGNARTALFNYLFARKKNGKFIIRVEDTDTKRNISGGEESQFKYLRWLGIDWDESIDVGGEFGPYRQTERLNLYKEYADALIEKKMAYFCYCTEEELEAERNAQIACGKNPGYSGKCRNLSVNERDKLEKAGLTPSIRFIVPEVSKTYKFIDMVKGEVSFESSEISDWVIIKKDGIATYNFAVVVDDHLMKITHVLRGDDHLTNTPKQLMIYEALGFTPPIFGHMTLIVNKDRKKLSKRDGSILQFIEQYADMGYLPEAIFNFIALLGWHPGGQKEILSKTQLIELFDETRLSKSPAFFDKEKLAWLNNKYIKELPIENLLELVSSHLNKLEKIPGDTAIKQKEWTINLLKLYQDYMTCGADILHLSKIFFQEKVNYNEEASEILKGEKVPAVLQELHNEVYSLNEVTAIEMKNVMKKIQEKTGQKGKMLFMPIRAALFGQVHGPDLMKSIELLGKNNILERVAVLIGG